MIAFVPRELGLTRDGVEISSPSYVRQPWGEQIRFGPALEDWGRVDGSFATDAEGVTLRESFESVNVEVGVTVMLEPVLGMRGDDG